MAVWRMRLQEEVLADFCERNGIRKLSLFGSALTERFSEASDIDLLVEFNPDQPVGYIRLAAIERELTALLGRKVDLRTPDEISPYFRSDVIQRAVVQYARE